MQNQRCPLAVKALLAGAIYGGTVLFFFLLFEATVTMTPDSQPRFRTARLILTVAAFVAGCAETVLFLGDRL